MCEVPDNEGSISLWEIGIYVQKEASCTQVNSAHSWASKWELGTERQYPFTMRSALSVLETRTHSSRKWTQNFREGGGIFIHFRRSSSDNVTRRIKETSAGSEFCELSWRLLWQIQGLKLYVLWVYRMLHEISNELECLLDTCVIWKERTRLLEWRDRDAVQAI